jgi:RNA polymerase sigma-32 factor
MLDRETEQKLARRWRRHKDRRAANALVESHLRYVVKIATQYRGYGFRLADLVEEGNLGLLEAATRFDPARNLRFMTYAAYWIRAYILAHVLKQWSLVGVGTGPLQSKMFFRLARERSHLAIQLGDGDASIDGKLAAKFNTTEERIQAMSQRLASRDASLDAHAFRDSALTLLETLAADDSTNQERRTADAERDALVRAKVDKVWPSLDPRERLIVEERLMAEDEATLADLGERLGLSRERVRQLEERVKSKLRRVLEPMARAA